MADKKFVSINLPKGLVEELKVWRAAYTAAYGVSKTYEQMLRGMLDSLEDTEPAVHAAFEKILKEHPELLDKFFVED